LFVYDSVSEGKVTKKFSASKVFGLDFLEKSSLFFEKPSFFDEKVALFEEKFLLFSSRVPYYMYHPSLRQGCWRTPLLR
jgi:hypothetical protein